MNRKSIYILLVATAIGMVAQAQESQLQKQYRERVLEYNQDVKAAGENLAAYQEQQAAAKADFKPKVTAGANFNYTGNPMELTLDLPSLGNPMSFQGQNSSYGAAVSLTQPLYAGGAVRENYKMSQSQSSMAQGQSDIITSDVSYQADVRYWSAVARDEMLNVAELSRQSVSQLVDVVRQRVEVEYTNRNDLLMAEVKLNEAEYRVMQANNDYQVARMAMNSFAGVAFDDSLPVDTAIVAISEVALLTQEMVAAVGGRPEIKVAQDKITIQQSSLKLNDSKYKPQFFVGADGNYSAPGHNFKPDMNPNYAVYAKLSMPIFEWGKRKSTKRASQYRVQMAEQNLSKVKDNISLELQSAYYSYSQAVGRVVLTENSLEKASENEAMAMERYREGNISIVEVIDAQMYRQQAQVNYIQSKMNAQINRSAFIKVLGSNWQE